MENPLIVLIAGLAGVLLGWAIGRARAERRSQALQGGLRAQLDGLQRELEERVLRIKQFETQQRALERDNEADQRRISELELEIGRLRMRIVDLESHTLAAKSTRSG